MLNIIFKKKENIQIFLFINLFILDFSIFSKSNVIIMKSKKNKEFELK